MIGSSAYPGFLRTANLFDRSAARAASSAQTPPADPEAGAKAILRVLKNNVSEITVETLRGSFGFESEAQADAALQRLIGGGLVERYRHAEYGDTIRLTDFGRRALDFMTV